MIAKPPIKKKMIAKPPIKKKMIAKPPIKKSSPRGQGGVRETHHVPLLRQNGMLIKSSHSQGGVGDPPERIDFRPLGVGRRGVSCCGGRFSMRSHSIPDGKMVTIGSLRRQPSG